jgi:YhcH/YjgK/YiaL family protein
MKRTKLLLLVLCVVASALSSVFAADANRQKPLTKKQLQWYNGRAWLKGISAQPDPTVDVATFVRHYAKHPGRWELAFKFMRENDLKTIPLGKKTLSDEVSVNVQEYTTREPGEERMEGHRKYIDLQYVVTGKELHGLVKIADAREVVPYDEQKDYAGFQASAITFHVASPEFFSIYFPSDIHFPNIQYGEKAPVRKVVFKIKVD